MPLVVTPDELAKWLAIQVRGPDVDALLQECADATTSYIEERLGAWVADPRPEHVHTAAVMQAARLYKRRNSPEGVAGFGELGVVRVSALDPDVELMLTTSLALHFSGGLPEAVPEPIVPELVEVGVWDWVTNTTPSDPGSGCMFIDAANEVLSISTTTRGAPGTDVEAALSAIESGDVLLLQERTDAESWTKWTVTGVPAFYAASIPVLHLDATWTAIPVALSDTGAAGWNPSGNDDILLVHVFVPVVVL